MRKQWVLRMVGLAGFMLFLALCFTPLSNLLFRRLAVGGGLAPADAIVVLSGGPPWASGVLDGASLRRAVHGIALHQQGLAPLLVFSGSYGEGPRSETGLRVDLARTCGVSEAAILTDSWARSTRDEAVRGRALLQPRRVRTILLVTDSLHMARAKRLFERAGFDVVAAPADDLPDSPTAPEGRLQIFRRVFQEVSAMLYYRAAGYL